MKPCNTCPFRKDTKNFGSPDWLRGVYDGIQKKMLNHSCHKTDPSADGYVRHNEEKESICIGFTAMTKAENNGCYDYNLMEKLMTGEIDWEDIETQDVFQTSREMLNHHLKAIVEKAK